VGKIIETIYHDNVSSITSFGPAVLNNSFYMLNDKKPVICTYYNINKLKSTLDPGSKIAYDNIGNQSPLRFNRIYDFLLYGIDRIELTTDIEEYGIESDKIQGDAYILPNTIVPVEGDYFEIEHITDSTWLFIVSDVQRDTLENGANAYKLTYKIEYVDNARIQDNVVDTYRLIEKREGTNIAKVVESDKLEEAKVLDKAAVTLKQYFIDLFYSDKVQAFIYMDLTEWRIYDPYMTEFLIRNKILDNGNDSYTHVCHQIPVGKTFAIEYDKSFLRAFEEKDTKKLLKSEYTMVPEDFVSYGSTFYSRYEAYFKAKYIRPVPSTNYRADCIPTDLIYRIYDNNLVTKGELCPNDNNKQISLSINILIKYFTGERITMEEVESLYELDYNDAMIMFYTIPLYILALEDAIENLLK
jgi:hypothetical protein